jgi:hypothetical protein
MASYTVQLNENGDASKVMGLAQLPESFTTNDLCEYVEKITGKKDNFTFYIKNRLFTENLKHMASVSHCTIEDVITIDYYYFDDNLQPDYKIELPGNVTTFKLSTDGKLLLATMSDKKFYVYTIEDAKIIHTSETSDIVLLIVLDKDQALGLTTANTIVDLYNGKVIYNGLSIPITCFVRSDTFIVGFDNGKVEAQEKEVVNLGARVMFIKNTVDNRTFMAVSELGTIIQYDMATREKRSISLGTEVTSCCYFDRTLYIGTTRGEIMLVSTALHISTLRTNFYYVDWICVNKKICATSNYKTLLLQKSNTEILMGSAPHGNQVVFIDGNEDVLLTGFNNYIYGFLTENM